MAFSVLNRRLLENEDIKSIVERVNYSTFKFDKLKSFGVDIPVSPMLTLQDFDSIAGSNFVYDVLCKKEWPDAWDYYYVLPMIRFEEIKDDSQIISEDENGLTIQYGSGLTSSVSSSDTIRKINMDSMGGYIFETNLRIPIFLLKDGQRIQLRVFKNRQNGEQYVFLNRQDNGPLDDSLNPNATFVGIVSPLTWTVDKKTGLAICNHPLFLAERFHDEYNKSELSHFLESDEFVKGLGVNQVNKLEIKPSSKTPFGEKKEKLSLEEKIRRVLMGEKRIPYLVGHPGIGKTQIAKSINKNCLAFNIATFTPDTFTGKTSIIPGDKIITQNGGQTIEHNEQGRTATAEPEWHTKLVEMSNRCLQKNERCVLLLDEFDKLTPNMQVFINGIVDSPRTIAGWIIPDNVDIILAGNSEEYSDAAFNISGEVASRLTKIEVSADAIDWLKWASKHDVDPIVRAYLHNFPNKIIEDVKDKNGDYDYAISLTPRSWDQKISEELKASRKIHSFPYLEPYMNEENRKALENFISVYFELEIEEILHGNIPDVPEFTHDKIQIIINCLIATATTEEEITNALAFISQNNLREYQALFEKRWMQINDSDDDILKIKLAKNSLDERKTGYGK